MSDGDRAALTRWGLPVVDECRMCGDVQVGTAPAITAGGRPLYGLGLLAGLEVGAEPATGAVWGVSGMSEVPDSFVNSSVANFVESAWRWYWAWQEIKPLRHSIEQYDLLDDFLAFVVRLDVATEQAEISFWREYVESW
ncbi:SUKH-4 immunity protein [Amycolatopsis tolypomycina]|uniref:SUKH-4 immunity protein n=2 Tax=Amycolatopsis tolypomycina TaxID=208445 RepID=A0A1H4Q7X5_9PSEU|nr:SUKH-4 immunity protein [Amycolatopsis tolypomycina]